MGICSSCRKETSDASVITCEGNDSIIFTDGKVLKKIPYDPKSLHFPSWFRCPDCNVVPGGKHHWNCDQEICPKCGGQLISCACFDVEGENIKD